MTMSSPYAKWLIAASLALLPMLLVTLALVIVMLGGCTSGDPTGPTVDITGNSGPVTVIIPTGSSSAAGTAPCAATTTANVTSTCPTSADASGNNSSAATTP